MIAAFILLINAAAAPPPVVPFRACWVNTGRVAHFIPCSHEDVARGYIVLPAEYWGDGALKWPERRWPVTPADPKQVLRDGGRKP